MIWCRRDLLSLAALLVCMPADQEDERVGHLNVLHFYRSNFTDWVVGGRSGAGGSYSRRWRFWYACQRVGKQARGTCFCAFPFKFYGLGAGEKKRVSASLYSKWQGFSMHVKGSEARARGVSLNWAFDVL